MAQDFHGETYFKRYVLAKLAYEAQGVALKRMMSNVNKEKMKIIDGNAQIDESLQNNQLLDSAGLRGESITIDGLGGYGPVPDNRLDTLGGPSNAGVGGPNEAFPFFDQILPDLDIDSLSRLEGNQNDVIKSDLDNFSKKSLRDEA